MDKPSCRICKNTSRYKCPNCLTHTCSLSCVNAHKELFNCTGLRRRPVKVDLHRFTTKVLKDDLNLLTGIVSDCDKAHKMFMRLSRHDNRKRVQFMQNELRQRGLNYKVGPKCMARHETNSSWFNKATGQIHWHLEWKAAVSTEDTVTLGVPDNVETKSVDACLAAALQRFRTNPEFVFKFRDATEYTVFWNCSKTKENGQVTRLFKAIPKTSVLRQIVELLATDPYTVFEYPTFYFTHKPELFKTID